MSFSTKRKPSRPPRPNLPYGNHNRSSRMSLEELNSSPTSSSQILSTRTTNQGNLPDYHNISNNAAYNTENPEPINNHTRRGSDGDRPSPRAVREQVHRKQSQRTRSKSMRQKARPCITIVSAAPMSQHPAFADGAKGSNIPPEAPPSYDEAMKASLPRNPSFTDPATPDHVSQQRRIFPAVETSVTSSCDSSLTPDAEAETQPKYSYRNSPESACISGQVVEPLVVSLPDQSNTNRNNSEGSPVQCVISEIETVSETNFECSRNTEVLEFINLTEEQHPVPTPRTKRRVSTQRSPMPSCSSSTLNTSKLQIEDHYSEEVKHESQPMNLSPNRKMRPPPRPATQPKSTGLPNTSDSQELNNKQPGSSTGVQDTFGVAVHQESNFLSRFDVGKDSLFNTNTSNPNKKSTSLQLSLNALHIPNEIEALTEVKESHNLNDNGEKQEPVYAQVNKKNCQSSCKPLPSKKPNIPIAGEALPETEQCAVGIQLATTPPPIPTRGLLMEDNLDTVEQGPSSDINHPISPSSSVENLYETVSQHKNVPNSQISPISSPTRTPKPGLIISPVIPPPLPTSRPVGNLLKGTECQRPQSSHMSRRASSSGELKKDKNAMKIIRRKSAHFKERGIKLFQKKASSDDVEKPTSASHDTNQERVKPKKVPPPRPALPVSLQKKHQQSPNLVKGPQTSKTFDYGYEEMSDDHLIAVDTSDENNLFKLDSKQGYPENENKATPRARPARPPPKKPNAIKTTSSLVSQQRKENTTTEPPVPKPRKQPQVSVVTTNDDSFDMQPLLPFVKPKPARPPPALLSNQMIPIPTKSNSQSNPLKEVQPEVDEKMKQYVKGEQHCIAIMTYKPTDFTHLTLEAGEKVLVIKSIDDSTLFGRNESGEEGPFPKKFVKPENTSDIEQCSQLTAFQSGTANQNSNNNSKTKTAENYVFAVFTYQSNNSEDLNFKTGELIKVIEKVSDMWLKGEIHGSVGIFPVNFVKPYIPKTENLLPKQSLPCVALYDFMENRSGFSFKQGDTIELIRIIDPQWFEGKHNDFTGIFPSNYIKLPPQENKIGNGLFQQEAIDCLNGATDKPINPPKLTKKSNLLPVYGTAIALYDFVGKDDNELSFKVDDVIEISKEVNNEWVEGKLNGKTGIFPVNFVYIT